MADRPDRPLLLYVGIARGLVFQFLEHQGIFVDHLKLSVAARARDSRVEDRFVLFESESLPTHWTCR